MRTNLILAATAAALAVPTTLTYLAETDVYTDVWAEMMFDGFDRNQITTIAMRRPRPPESGQLTPSLAAASPFQELAFQKVNGRWVFLGGPLPGAPVSEDLIEQRIFQHLVRVSGADEAVIFPNANPETLERNQLTKETAFVISCQTGPANNRTVVAELMIGKNVSGGREDRESVPGYYVLKSGTNDIVLYETPVWERPLEENAWVDRIVHNIPKGSIARFSLKNQKTEAPIVFQKRPGSDATWLAIEKPEGFGEVNQQELSAVLDRYTHIQHQSLVGPATPQLLAEKGLRPPSTLEVIATLDDGSEYAIQVGNKVPDKLEYYATSTGLDFVRTIPEWVVTNFQIGPEKLLGPASVKDDVDKDAEPVKEGKGKDTP